MRIDMVCSPRDASRWKDTNPYFGIEVKLEPQLDSAGDFTQYAAQSIDYASTKFDGYGYMYVFCYPPIFKARWIAPDIDYWASRLLWRMGVGQLRDDEHGGLTLYGQHSHRLWSESDGPVEAKTWSFRRKFGRR